MKFDIEKEIDTVIEILGDNKLNKNDFSSTIYYDNILLIERDNRRAVFLCHILLLTTKYPHVELYLKNLLNHFTVDELEKLYECIEGTVLHYMACCLHVVSLNAFEIIINYGVNINIKSRLNNTAAHILFNGDYNKECNNHTCAILNLLINNGADLNIINKRNETVLDTLTRYQSILNVETKNCIMMLIDFGATTNNPVRNTKTHDFIEYYKSSTIKPAIKK